jgi:hypothetical protein
MLEEMIQKGDRRYEVLLRHGNVRELIQGGLSDWQFSVTIWHDLTVPTNRPVRTTTCDPVIQSPSDTGFVVSEPIFKIRRSARHRVSEEPPTPPMASIRMYCIGQILPVHLRTNQEPRISIMRESPFACVRYRKLVGLDRDDGLPQNMMVTARRPPVKKPVGKPSEVKSARR